MKELFEPFSSSVAFSREVASYTFFVPPEGSNTEKFSLNHLERQKLDKMIMLLEHTELQTLIQQGCITLGAIKPKAHESKLYVDNDIEGEQKILSMISVPLQVIFTTSLKLSTDDLTQFYPAELKSSLTLMKEGDTDRWDLFQQYMMSGPVTYMLLYEPDGNAVDEWRKQMGLTDPSQASSESIRGKFALSIRQNLVHGTSGNTTEEKVENVKREIAWVKNKLTLLKDQSHRIDNSFLTESLLHEIGLLDNEDRCIMIKRLFNFRAMGGESFLAAYAVAFQDQAGKIQSRYVAQKAIVSLGNSQGQAETRVKRLMFLNERGVKIPRLYGLKNADIFEEYILHACDANEAIQEIQSHQCSQEHRFELLSQLTQVASVLDKEGFIPVGSFWSNLIYDGNHLYFVDTGCDLGDPHQEESSNRCKKQLLQVFTDIHLRHLIEELYSL